MTLQGPASSTVTAVIVPSGLNSWVMPSFLARRPFIETEPFPARNRGGGVRISGRSHSRAGGLVHPGHHAIGIPWRGRYESARSRQDGATMASSQLLISMLTPAGRDRRIKASTTLGLGSR